ncbi:hypothetical protein PACTADRAFT_49188 [Pachysolen tannophilus NRRL Y-2460]|uniref:Uncharacterized protein n=1 Tax=Pachysolen tannophilus NRRL Y-2460 TaxID=669874 RepID=A0A1E4TVC7_PACTA|nr:hypothetical protein PACTADRAFT_49188 [Pachysolen tannophilus NRRL Y-2460]
MTKEFSQLLINSKGCISFTGSVASILPVPWNAIYGASKAALKHYCEILSLEMRPFNVKVLNFITGGVDTEIFELFKPIPESSRYYSEATEKSLHSLNDAHKMDSKTYAKKVVNDILHTNRSREVPRGAGATAGYLLSLLPISIVSFLFIKVFKLDGVFEAIRQKAKARFVE